MSGPVRMVSSAVISSSCPTGKRKQGNWRPLMSRSPAAMEAKGLKGLQWLDKNVIGAYSGYSGLFLNSSGRRWGPMTGSDKPRVALDAEEVMLGAEDAEEGMEGVELDAGSAAASQPRIRGLRVPLSSDRAPSMPALI
jgi:hypothetical protein